MLVHCLTESPATTVEVRSAAVKATASFALAHSEEKHIVKQLHETVPHMINFLQTTMLMEVHCDAALNSFVELAEKCPQLLRHQFDPLVQLCLRAIVDKNVPEERKHLALEVIVSLAESIPATFRKRGANYLPQISEQSCHNSTRSNSNCFVAQFNTCCR